MPTSPPRLAYKVPRPSSSPLGVLLLALFSLSERVSEGQPVFEDRTAVAGLNVDWAFGIATIDYDNDGWTDLMVAADSSNSRLFRNLGNGHYSDETERTGLSLEGNFHSPLLADLNNDGWSDLLLVGTHESRVFLADGLGGFVDHTAASGLAAAGGKTAALGDFDNDGLLDLFIAISQEPDRLFRNEGDGHFDDITAESRTAGPPEPLAMQTLWLDFNHDGWLDLLAVHDVDDPSRLYLNNGRLPFTNVADATGFSEVGTGNSMGVGVGDVDGDGWEDVYVTRIGEGGLYRNDQGVSLSLMEDALGAWRNGWSWGVVAGDFDNDADQDLFIVSTSGLGGAPTLLFENRRSWLYELSPSNWLSNKTSEPSADGAFGFGLAQADLDLDGRLDLVFPTRDGPVVLLHGAGAIGNWIQLRLDGSSANRDAIGARVEARTSAGLITRSVRAGDSYRSQSDHVVHMGLGAADLVDELVVHWGGLQSDTLRGVPAGRRYVIHQRTGEASATGLAPRLPAASPEGLPSLDAFPLPASSSVSLRIDGAFTQTQISLTDILGRRHPTESVILSESWPWEASLDVDGLASGVYLVRVTSEVGVFTRTIAVTR